MGEICDLLLTKRKVISEVTSMIKRHTVEVSSCEALRSQCRAGGRSVERSVRQGNGGRLWQETEALSLAVHKDLYPYNDHANLEVDRSPDEPRLQRTQLSCAGTLDPKKP